jgi:hypothetical protein
MRGTDMLGTLAGGEEVLATDVLGVEIRGRVDLAAPGLGVLWVWEYGTGERRLLHAAEYDLATLPA